MSRYSTLLLPLLLVACGDDPPEAFSDCAASEGHDDLDLATFEDGSGESLSIDGDTLSVAVGYGGGCEEHAFEICWPDKAFMESNPVQVNLEIWHGGPQDNCEAYLTEVLEFDLAPLKAGWQDAYGEGAGTITIHVLGESVDYSFE
ncbi:MAG: hypothetical protein VX899_27525 [Myxococcota bacterium]|nr:hypothetical protein [Myxococcota bacterium]